jgi:hypothetical protein
MEGSGMNAGPVLARDHARRNRMIATVAGAITVIAIVLGFAGDVLGLPWHWMRPAAELLLLAELVGLVVMIVFGKGHVYPWWNLLPSLQLVANYGVGYDRVDVDACRARGVAVPRSAAPRAA